MYCCILGTAHTVITMGPRQEITAIYIMVTLPMILSDLIIIIIITIIITDLYSAFRYEDTEALEGLDL